MALTTYYTPRWRAIDANGDPMNGAILKFFEAGTSTPLPVYADVNGVTSLGVTVTADAGGLFAELFMLGQAYKIELYTSANVLVWTADDWFPPQAASAANVDVFATAGVTLAAGEGAYVSDGSGGLNAGQLYKWDADLEYASSTPEAYVAVGAITAGAIGLFREAGIVTGLSGLVPGARYFISGTAGAFSTSAGTFRRMVGQAKSTTEMFLSTNPPSPDVVTLVDPRVKTLCNGRLTLTTGVPVTVSDVTAATSIFWAPYVGNEIALYSGTAWVTFALSQLTLAVPATTNTAYDLFIDYHATTPTLTLLAWTNLTTRSTALTTQDGVLVLTGSLTRRYVGSFRTTGVSGQTESSAAKRYLWNYYNRVDLELFVADATATWAYSTATIRQARATATNQVEAMVGVQEVDIDLTLHSAAADTAGGAMAVGIGEDSTTTFATGAGSFKKGSDIGTMTARLVKKPAIGFHTYSWNEWAAGVGTGNWYGSQGDSTPAGVASGLRGYIQG